MIILFGLAGSGKGTQGNALAELFGWRWLSAGQLIRDSGKYDAVLKDGNMISDADMIDLLEKDFTRNDADGFNIILDGFPRTADQAKWLISQKSQPIEGAIILEVPKAELYERLELRARDDDQSKSSIDHRWALFEQNIGQILPIFADNHIPVERVDGVGEVNAVTARLVAAIKQFTSHANVQKQDVNNTGEIEKSYGE